MGMILLGCGSNFRESYVGNRVHHEEIRRYRVHVDKNFSDMDRVELKRAMGQWEWALGGYIGIEVVNWNFDMDVGEIRQV